MERQRHPDLAGAIAALQARGEQIRVGGDLEAVRMLRDFEPAERVAARLEVSIGSIFRSRSAGVDVMGDGSVVAFRGGVGRRPLEPREGESPFDAVAHELSG